MNTLKLSRRVAVISALVEGNSIRATVRMTGAAKNTVVKLLAEMGRACEVYAHEFIRNVPSQAIQVDEIWAFCYAKAKNVPADKKGVFGFGDVWTWTAIDADSKLMVSWLVGRRDGLHATHFMKDVASRVTGRPPACKGCKKTAAFGNPDMEKASTSYVERQNLTMRMGMRRFTRLTNGFSKKVENLEHAVSLHFMHYNFCRVHQTLKQTPAQAAGLADHRWSIEELVGLLDRQNGTKAA